MAVSVLIALLVCLIPTTIGGLLSAIGIAGMDRVVQHNIIAFSGRAVEACGDVNTLLLDKTGTITLGNRQAVEFVPLPGVTVEELADRAQLASLPDETPEGRSIVVLAKEKHGLRGRTLMDGGGSPAQATQHPTFIPFSAATRMSGVDTDGTQLRKGAADAIARWVQGYGIEVPARLNPAVEQIARTGGTPLVVAEHTATSTRVLGVVHLKDVVKGGMKDRFDHLRAMGIRTVMITGDNPLTAAAIAAEAGVDDFLAEAKPEDKLALIRKEQSGGRMVAMTGDGTNDAPALAQADVGLAMNTGTQAAKEAGNLIDLDSNPTKLIELVEIGKQLLITRGSLTTFSIANDVAKYFAIIPAMFAVTYPELNALNVMRLHSPTSAILSAVIFNALIIIALIPLALRGVRYRPAGAAAILRRNFVLYGIGRGHRPLHRDQAPRCNPRPPSPGLIMIAQTPTSRYRVDAAVLRHHRPGLSRGGNGHCPARLPEASERLDRHGQRPRGRQRADRPVVHGPVLLPFSAFGRRCRVRCDGVRRHQQGTDGPEARRHPDRGRGGQRREGGWRREGQDPVGHGDGVCFRPGPAHLPRQRRSAGRDGSPGSGTPMRRRCATSWLQHTEGRQFGFLGEPRINVLAAEHRAGQRLSAAGLEVEEITGRHRAQTRSGEDSACA